MDQKRFLSEYRISEDQFGKTGLEWKKLLEIKDHYERKVSEFDDTGKAISNTMLKCGDVHSVRYRIKEPEHLIEKIIRKTIDDPDFSCTIDDYHTKITDLIGVRTLHLFKEDWANIHDFIQKKWKLTENSVANVREGDSDEMIEDYKKHKCEIKHHEYGYRSVHYVVETTLFKETHFVEIQVRTIFEEGWSEIDHKIRYPYDRDNFILTPYLAIFNRLSGSADEMGSYIVKLKNYIETVSKEYEKAVQIEKKKRKELERKIENLAISQEDKKGLKTDILRFTLPRVVIEPIKIKFPVLVADAQPIKIKLPVLEKTKLPTSVEPKKPKETKN